MNAKHLASAIIATALTCATYGDPAIAATKQYTIVDLGPGPNGRDAYGYSASASAQAGAYFLRTISCGRACTAKIYDAVAWTGPSSSPVDITPSNYPEAWAYGAGGTLIVGTVITNNGGYFGFGHAAVWKGSSHTFTDINPSGNCGSCSPGSNAYSTDGTFIAGSGGAPEHALLWNIGQLQSPVDLNPSGYNTSEAYVVHGGVQGGYGISIVSNTAHALLWNGSAASAVDLTPSTVNSAYVTGLGNLSECGYGTLVNSSSVHALYWRGTAASLVDLHPLGFNDSFARAAHNGMQVGYGHVTGTGALHALLWKGTAKSAVDLQQFLPGTYTSSEAFGVDPKGDIIGAAYSTTAHTWHAVMWVP